MTDMFEGFQGRNASDVRVHCATRRHILLYGPILKRRESESVCVCV